MNKKSHTNPTDHELAKALAHPLRVVILRELSKAVSSPNRLSKELDEPLGNVSYHVKTLLEYNCIELVKTEPRRGAVEHFYRAVDTIAVPGSTELTKRQRELIAEVLSDGLRNGLAERLNLSPTDLRELAAAKSALDGVVA